MVATLLLASLLALLGAVGLLDSLYFVAVTHRWVAPDADWIPRVCRMDERTCAAIVDTRYARVFGLSNAAYGAVWYLVLIGLATWTLRTGSLPACNAVLLAAAGVVVFSVYLVWALVQRLSTPCPLCYLAHGVNLAVLGVVATACIAT